MLQIGEVFGFDGEHQVFLGRTDKQDLVQLAQNQHAHQHARHQARDVDERE